MQKSKGLNIRDFIEGFLTSAPSIFSFTLGYLESFKIPEIPTFTQAGYFFATIIHSFVSGIIWSLLASNIAVLVLGLCLLGLVTRNWVVSVLRRIRWLSGVYQKVRPWVQIHPPRRTQLFFGAVLSLLMLVASLAYTLEYYRGKEVFLEISGILSPLTKPVFVILLFLSILLVPLVTALDRTLESEVQSRFARVGFVISGVAVSMSLSFQLGYRFAGSYLHFPLIRLSESDQEVHPLLWHTENKTYVLDCVDSGEWTVKGVSDGKAFYINDVDRFRFSALCPGVR